MSNQQTQDNNTPLVRHEHDEKTGIHRIILDRPKARNAISRKVLQELDSCLDRVEDASPPPQTHPARCLILCSSSDKAFCAGADLAERRTMSPEEIIEYLSKLRIVMDKLQNMPVPTIAAIDGPALGGGLELALCCDFRIAALARQPAAEGENSESAPLRPLLGFPECQLGIIPGAGGTQRAARLLGVSRAKSLVFTGKLLDAEEAHSWGLVEYVCDSPSQSAVERAIELAQKMQKSAPLALSAAKAAIDVGEEMDLQPGLDWEAACYHALLPTQDRREALTAFAEKRKPQFQGR
ncbi:putative enoyl-CoA hydratase/isomerase [Meira miltonrushii]|uniref:Putative enoyl-CoA hydratase/isomerase n=1 Tax=Meira miltonrushii TaxID=1280837 RepID=A0A316VGE0_9BASI|nr:putative enoyl-CoA hydratase/isomerase [Meira miltonrushii]PWN36596.1 putative enoyl-CoA hydratase/isomerase [Meira miltonrushii]